MITATTAATATMQAIVQRGYGEADVLHVGTVDRPTIGAGQVLVEVRAAGLDRGTWHLMAGIPYAVRMVTGLRSPKQPVPGLDLSGVVVEVGPDVTRFAVGDEVFGIGKGSFAEFAAANENKLAHKPACLTFDQAAALGVSGLTALQGLRDAGRLVAGQHVLIIGASGGVGTYAVQIAKAFGATVTGVCSGAKADLVRSLGADHVVDYATVDYTASGPTYDVILDLGSDAPLSRLRRALTADGTLVVAGGEGGRWLGVGRQFHALALSPFVGQRLTGLLSKEHFADLEVLAELAENGRLTAAIERTYSLSEVPDAMRHLVAGRARGKLVITMD